MPKLTSDQVATILNRAVLLWSEEPYNVPNREGLPEALRRIWPFWNPELPLFHIEKGKDCNLEFDLRENEHGSYFIIFQKSHPGNNAIYVADATQEEKQAQEYPEIMYGVGVRDGDPDYVGMIAGPFPTVEQCKGWDGQRHVIVELPSGRILYRWKMSSGSWIEVKSKDVT